MFLRVLTCSYVFLRVLTHVSKISGGRREREGDRRTVETPETSEDRESVDEQEVKWGGAPTGQLRADRGYKAGD